MELFSERGFEQTTVAEIAARAGLTERTFFRHYGDKREVLFAGGEAFQERFAAGVTAAPDAATPMQAVAAAVESAATALDEYRGREFARRRQAIIVANPELRERELIKLAASASAVAEALRARGVEEPAASLSAEMGIAAFKVAFERWVADAEQRSLPELLHEALASLAEVSAG
jgi:AcrR family transcriptional regulator